MIATFNGRGIRVTLFALAPRAFASGCQEPGGWWPDECGIVNGTDVRALPLTAFEPPLARLAMRRYLRNWTRSLAKDCKLLGCL